MPILTTLRGAPHHAHTARWQFVLLLLAFVGNGLLWNAITRPGIPPDEISHFDYVRHLAVFRSLPIYGETRMLSYPDAYHPHAVIPPLFYLPGAPVQALVSNQPLETQVFAVRLISVLIGAATVAIIYLLGRALVPARPTFALAAAALVGFNPTFTHITAAINSDNLINLLTAAIFLLLLRGLQEGQPGRRWLVGLGTLIGLGLITKQSIFFGGVASGLALVWLAWNQQGHRLRSLVGYGAWVGGVALLISGWSFVRNLMIYGSLTGLSLVSKLNVYPATPYRTIGSLGEMLSISYFLGSFRTFWGYSFFFQSPLLPYHIYLLLIGIAAGGAIGVLVWLWRAWNQRHNQQMQPLLVLAIISTITAGILLYSLISYSYTIDYQGQGRYFFPLLAPLSLALVGGWEQVAGWARVRHLAAPLLIVFMLAFNLVAFFIVLVPANHANYRLSAGPQQVVYGPFEAQTQFEVQQPTIDYMEMLLHMSPGVEGPLIWRVVGTEGTLFSAVEYDIPRIPARYTLSPPPEQKLVAGQAYTLTIQAPWAAVDKPLLAYLPPVASEKSSDTGLRVVYDKPLAQTWLSTITYHMLSAPSGSLRHAIQLLFFAIVPLLFVALASAALAPLLSGVWRVVGGAALLALFVALLATPGGRGSNLPTSQVTAQSGPLLTLEGNNSPYIADLLLLADSPTARKYPADDPANTISHVQPVRFRADSADGTEPRVLAMHPTSAVTYTLTLPERAYFRSAIGLSPPAWEQGLEDPGGSGDGVEFVARIYCPCEEDGSREVLRRFLDPTHNPDERKWHPVSIDLSDYGGQTIQLELMTLPGPAGNTRYDWAGWKHPVIEMIR